MVGRGVGSGVGGEVGKGVGAREGAETGGGVVGVESHPKSVDADDPNAPPVLATSTPP